MPLLEIAVRTLWANRSIRAQLIAVGVGSVIVTSILATILVNSTDLFGSGYSEMANVRLLSLFWLVGMLIVGCIVAVMGRALRPLDQIRDSLNTVHEDVSPNAGNAPAREVKQLQDAVRDLSQQLRGRQAEVDSAQQALAKRAKTVDRLLDFSQTIQGAGKTDQVLQTLSFFLQSELGLAGIAVLAHEPESNTPFQLKASWPKELFTDPESVCEMDASLCPCVRQDLPRHFRADGSPVRCAIDKLMNVVGDLPAYCMPFNVGPRVKFLVHMTLPETEIWTEERRQLAHTYVNTAYSALISLHHLAEAEKQSLTDALTGLYNRRSMESLLQREIALAERHSQPLSCVMIDMDKFKEINDEHGHAAGDFMLKAFADCVRITLRKTDLPFRYGGDEFVIALPQTPLHQAKQVVQKLRQAFGSVDFTSAIAKLNRQPTLSIGVAERSKSTNILTLQALLGAADQALYDAKNSNRNCVKIYQPPTAAA